MPDSWNLPASGARWQTLLGALGGRSRPAQVVGMRFDEGAEVFLPDERSAALRPRGGLVAAKSDAKSSLVGWLCVASPIRRKAIIHCISARCDYVKPRFSSACRFTSVSVKRRRVRRKAHCLEAQRIARMVHRAEREEVPRVRIMGGVTQNRQSDERRIRQREAAGRTRLHDAPERAVVPRCATMRTKQETPASVERTRRAGHGRGGRRRGSRSIRPAPLPRIRPPRESTFHPPHPVLPAHPHPRKFSNHL